MQVNDTFPGFWNIAVYRKQDENTNFYLTGTVDATHTNKRYYQVVNPENFTFSVLILETNNTDVNVTIKREKSISNLQSAKV